MTYMLTLKCALKLVEEIILYYDARSEKHQISKGIMREIKKTRKPSKLFNKKKVFTFPFRQLIPSDDQVV